MNITPQDIKSRVDALMSGSSLVLSAPLSSLGTAGIDEVINRYFSGNLNASLQLVDGETATIDGNFVTYTVSIPVSGFSMYDGNSVLQARLIFEGGEAIQLTVEVDMPSGYGLANSFGLLAQMPTLPINQLTLENSTLLLNSRAPVTIDFRSEALPLGPLKGVDWLLDDRSSLQGTIQEETIGGELVPVIMLTAPISDGYSFGDFNLKMNLRVCSFYVDTQGATPPFYFNSKVEVYTVFETGKLNIPVVLPLYGEGQYLMSFHVDTSAGPVQIGNINDLSGFAGGQNLDELLIPEVLPGNAALSLDNLSFILDPRNRQLINFQIGVGLSVNWEIIPDIISLTGIGGAFEVNYPTIASARSISAMLYANLKVGDVDLETSVSLPEMELQAKMQEGDEIDINALMGTFADGLSLPGDGNLSIYELEVYAKAKKGEEAYMFNAAAQGDLTIVDGLTIEQIFLGIAYQDGSLYEAGFGSTLRLGNSGIGVALQALYRENQGWEFEGRMLPGETIALNDLVADLTAPFGSVDLPEVLDGLAITNLQIKFNSQSKDFSFNCQTQFPLDDQMANLSLNIDIVNSTNGFQKSFSGILTIGSREFAVAFDSNSTASTLMAGFSNPEGEEIHLVNDLLGLVSSNPDLEFNDEFNLLEFTLYHLELSFEKNKSNGQKSYRVIGDFGWNPNFAIGDSDSLTLRAAIDLTKPAVGKLNGNISGHIQTPIPNLEFLDIEAFYLFSQTSSSMGLRVRLGDVALETAYSSTSSLLNFSVNSSSPLTLSKGMNFFAGLVNPSIDDFEFDPPWSTFTNLEIPINDFQFSLNTQTKAIGLVYEPGSAISIPGLPSSLLSINRVNLDYGVKRKNVGGATKDVKGINISLDARFLGRNQTLRWDPVNDAPPEVPGKGASVFDLRYLGMGQHVVFTKAAEITSIKEVMTLLRDAITERTSAVANDGGLSLRNPLDTFGDGGVIAFSPESEWLIGLDVTLLKTLSVQVIFNDPVIYGLRLELSGKLAKNFAGLQFELLYQRITDNIGKYHIDLTLPSFVRYFTVGAVSVTLPSLVLDIFTNGDFKVDLGFPWNFNFSRSFALEVFPFTGAGGFYFNKLSAATASSTPRIPIEKGVFTPVYEFGLGLKMGLGKSFRSGPLNAEISLTVQGLIEGVISWYNPAQVGDRELFYRVKGGVAIVGRLYGEVDFGIISASVEVVARAMVRFLLESYQPIKLLLSARVSVRASVKCGFFRIRFSFRTTVRQSFTLPSPEKGTAPWLN